MRSQFRGYYAPSEDEYADLWSAGTVILDTNSLLNLYRYSETTGEQFVSVLARLNGRLWIPAQVAHEFLKNRLNVIHEQASAYEKVRDALEASRKAFKSSVSPFKRHSSLDANRLMLLFDQSIDAVASEIRSREQDHRLTVDQARDADDVLTTISNLYEGRVGEAFDDAELKGIHAEGATRYALEMPPGYKDASKDAPDRYGDLVIWKQVLQHAADSSTSAIFVTDDGKEDWWRIFRGQRLGPRPELVDEYFAVSGKRVHFYSPEQFLREAQTRFGLQMTDATIGEVQQVSTQRPQRLRLVAERRLQDLEARRENLLKVIDRPSPRSQRSRELHSRLLAQRDDLLQQIQVLETASSVELREGLDDAKAHGVGIQRVQLTTRTRLEKVNQRLQELEEDAPSELRAEHEGLHHQLELLDAEVLETVEALSEFQGEEDEEALTGR